MIKINIEYLPAINYSLINNRIAVCQSIEIQNESTEDIKDIIIFGKCTKHFKNIRNNRRIIADFALSLWLE